MTETKDKVITLESLAILHAYNQNAYMPKTNNVLTLIDLDEAYLQCNPNDFAGFIMEIENTDNKTKQIMFTGKTSNSATLDVKAQTSLLDENGDMLLYELYFYLENGKYAVESTLIKIALLTGIKTISPLSYNKLYGIKIA